MTIAKFADNAILLHANHALAAKTLKYDIELMKVIARGSGAGNVQPRGRW